MLLPAPVGPTIATVSPGRTSRLTSCSIGRPGVVAERHVLEADVSGDGRTSGRASGPVVDVAPGLEDLEHAPGAAGGALGGRRRVHQRLERPVERGQVGEEDEDAADREPAVEHALRARAR